MSFPSANHFAFCIFLSLMLSRGIKARPESRIYYPEIDIPQYIMEETETMDDDMYSDIKRYPVNNPTFMAKRPNLRNFLPQNYGEVVDEVGPNLEDEIPQSIPIPLALKNSPKFKNKKDHAAKKNVISEKKSGKFIPATQRPDGTWRKARRVKEGYVPQEEVPLYESKGRQIANRKPDRPVGMPAPTATPSKKEKQKKKKAALPAGVIVLPKNSATSTASPKENNTGNKKSTASVSTNSSTTATGAVPSVDTPASVASVESITKDLNSVELDDLQLELSKKVKKLKKKIREIEAIEVKLKAGELKKPEKDQLDKVKRKKGYLKELEELGYQPGAED